MKTIIVVVCQASETRTVSVSGGRKRDRRVRMVSFHPWRFNTGSGVRNGDQGGGGPNTMLPRAS